MCCVCGGGADPATGEAFYTGTAVVTDGGSYTESFTTESVVTTEEVVTVETTPQVDSSLEQYQTVTVVSDPVVMTTTDGGVFTEEYVMNMPVTESYSEAWMCMNTDFEVGATDSSGKDCNYYIGNKAECGLYDDDEFFASQMCCPCDGGNSVQVDPATMDTTMMDMASA